MPHQKLQENSLSLFLFPSPLCNVMIMKYISPPATVNITVHKREDVYLS